MLKLCTVPSPKQIIDRCEDLYIVQFKLLKLGIWYPELERNCYYLNNIEKNCRIMTTA